MSPRSELRLALGTIALLAFTSGLASAIGLWIQGGVACFSAVVLLFLVDRSIGSEEEG